MYVQKFTTNFYKVKEGEINSDLNYKDVRCMYQCAIVWGHGMKNIVDILNILCSLKKITILHIKRNSYTDIKKLIEIVYKNELVDLKKHIKSKTTFLRHAPKEYILILFKNIFPELKQYGAGKYSTITDVDVNNIKWQVRELFNPKSTNTIASDKLSVGISHNHVIHITDYPNEAEYISTSLLNNNCNYYENIINKGFLVPYHIVFNKIKPITINIDNIYARLASNIKNIIKIDDTPHYYYVKGIKQTYIDYYETHVGYKLTDNHCPVAFDNLIDNFNPFLYRYENYRFIIIKNISGHNVVVDGLHRLAILKKNNIKTIPVIKLSSKKGAR
jgi:hypothetical protein